MIVVKVKTFATLKIMLDSTFKINLKDDATVHNLLKEIFKKYGEHVRESIINPDTGELRKYHKILRNGINIDFLQGLDTPLKNGDEVAIFPPIGGG